MTEALSRHRDEAYAESLARQFAEKKCKQLEGDVRAARIQEAKLKQENMRLAAKVKQLRIRLRVSNNEIKKALMVLYGLGPRSPSDDGDDNLAD